MFIANGELADEAAISGADATIAQFEAGAEGFRAVLLRWTRPDPPADDARALAKGFTQLVSVVAIASRDDVGLVWEFAGYDRVRSWRSLTC